MKFGYLVEVELFEVEWTTNIGIYQQPRIPEPSVHPQPVNQKSICDGRLKIPDAAETIGVAHNNTIVYYDHISDD